MKKRAKEQVPLATPAELAQVAVSLAAIAGTKEPDLEGQERKRHVAIARLMVT